MSNQNKNEAVITELKQKVQELTEFLGKKIYNNTFQFNYNFSKWKSETEYILRENFYDDSRQLVKFIEVSNIDWNQKISTETPSIYREKIMLEISGGIRGNNILYRKIWAP